MNQMEYNILRRAQDSTKASNRLDDFFRQRGVDFEQVKKNPEYYEELIKQYSRTCINQGLFEESRERMEDEFSKLCEFHRRKEDELVEKFFRITKDLIRENMDEDEAK